MRRTDAREVARRALGRLEGLRAGLRLTQRELGDRIGYAQSTLAQVLKGSRGAPNIGTLVRVADGLHAEVVVDVRPINPVTPAADPSGECFACPCGFEASGPAGEVATIEQDWNEKRRSWAIWIPVGPSSYQLEVESHVKRCRVAASRFHVENF